MKMTNNTILITGGSAGLGLEFAKQLLEKNNTVIICGRNKQRLNKVQKEYPQLKTIECDVSDASSLKNMLTIIEKEYPTLNVLINNAGAMHLHDVSKNSLAFGLQQQEIETNFTAVVALCDALIPHFKQQKESAIINITSGLAYMPFVLAPVYAATKAAVHSYSQSIRQALKGSSISIFEVLPPMIDTEMTESLDMPSMKKVSAGYLTEIIIKKIEKNILEIRPGASSMMIKMYKLFPWMINSMMLKMAPKVLLKLPKYEL